MKQNSKYLVFILASAFTWLAAQFSSAADKLNTSYISTTPGSSSVLSVAKEARILDEAWDWHAKFMPDAPYPPADGYRLVLQDMAEKNPKAAQANVKDYIDTRFIRELENSGFIKNLSRK